MEHVVFFPAPDGTPAFRRVASLEDAVRLVEHLRNVEGVNEVSVHALSEVPLAFKAWYRVEIPAAAAVVEQPVEPLALDVPGIVPDIAPDAAVVLQVAPDPVPEAVEPAPEAALELVVPEQGEHADLQEPVAAMAAGHTEPAPRPSSLGFFAS